MKTVRSLSAPKPVARGPSRRSGLAAGILTGAVIGACVTAYAYLSPATYRAHSAIELTRAESASLPELERGVASTRLREAVLDQEVLELLVEDRVREGKGESPSSAGRSVREVVGFRTQDGRTFEIYVRDSQPTRAAEIANLLAERAARAAPKLLGPNRQAELERVRRDRQKKNDELLQFLAAHPELTAQAREEAPLPHAPSLTPPPPSNLEDLRAERARIKLRLAPRATQSGAKNPYSNPSTVDAEAPELERRLAELEAILAPVPPPRAPAKREVKPLVAEGLTKELASLLKGVADSKAREEAVKNAPPAATARVTLRARPPSAPIEPNRMMILFWGALSALVAGSGVALWRRAGLSLISSRPPPPRGESVELPAEIHRVSSSAPLKDSGARKRPASDTLVSEDGDGAAGDSTAIPAIGMATTQHAALDSILFPDSSSPLAPSAEAISARQTGTPSPSSGHRARSATSPSSSMHDTVHQAFESGAQRLVGPSDTAVPRYAVIEVNAELSTHASQQPSSAPTRASARALAAEKTHVLGSPIQPILAPGSRKTPSSGRNRNAPLAPATGYSYVSTPPPGEFKRHASSGPYPHQASKTVPPRVQLERVEAGWRPDLSLLPESRRSLARELFPEGTSETRVVVVAAPIDVGDEKSRVAAELSLALAEGGQFRVLLIDANLRRPQTHRFLRVAMPRGFGFSQQLRGRIEGASSPWTAIECSGSLHALCESETPLPELILTQAFEDCLKELRGLYDRIVIDGPFTSDIPACRAVEDVVDAAVFVHLRSKAVDVSEARSLFPGKPVALIAAAG